MVELVKKLYYEDENRKDIWLYITVDIVNADYYGDVKYIEPCVHNGKQYTILKRTYFPKKREKLCCGVVFIRDDFLAWLDAVDCVVYDGSDVFFIELDTERKKFDWVMYWNV